MKSTPVCCYAQQPDEAHTPRPETLPADFQLSSRQPPVASAISADAPTYRGRFKPGFDPRRHQFTDEERSRGWWTAIAALGVSIGVKLHRAGRWPNYRGRRAAR